MNIKTRFYTFMIVGGGLLGATFVNDYYAKGKIDKINNDIAANEAASKNIQVVLASCYEWTQTSIRDWQGESELKHPERAKLSREKLAELDKERVAKEAELTNIKKELLLFYKGR
jgi:hypothetical protein